MLGGRKCLPSVVVTGKPGAQLLSSWALVVVRGAANFITSWRAAAKRLFCLHVNVKRAMISDIQKLIAAVNRVLIVRWCLEQGDVIFWPGKSWLCFVPGCWCLQLHFPGLIDCMYFNSSNPKQSFFFFICSEKLRIYSSQNFRGYCVSHTDVIQSPHPQFCLWKNPWRKSPTQKHINYKVVKHLPFFLVIFF